MHRYDQTSLLWIGSILHFLLKRVLQTLDMASGAALVSFHLLGQLSHYLLPVYVHLNALLLDLLRDFLVDLSLLVCLALSFALLSH